MRVSRAFLLAAALLLCLAACGSNKDPLTEALAAKVERKLLALEGLLFEIDVPQSLQTEITRDPQGIPLQRIQRPGADPASVPPVSVQLLPKNGFFPASKEAAEELFAPNEEGWKVDVLETVQDGWLLIASGAGNPPAVEVHTVHDANPNYDLHCKGRYEGKRTTEARDHMKRICASLALKRR